MSHRFTKVPPTIVAICSYAVMAGFFTQSGVILAPAAHFFGRSVPDTASMFSFLVGGNLVGILASLVVFNVATLRATFFYAYAVMFVGIAILCLTHSQSIASLGIGLVGFGGGLGLSAGALIITETYGSNQRAIAFLGTDCAFSIAGFVFPALAGLTIAHGLGWPSGYVVVAATAALLLVGTIWVRFPLIGKKMSQPSALRTEAPAGAFWRVGFIGGALALYLGGQSVFLIWAPTYLQSIFAVSERDAGRVVSSFWGPSIFGLIAAALLATRVAPRPILFAATGATVTCLLAIAMTSSSAIFFVLTAAFGLTSTCMYKLMISIGSEQLGVAPPQLITFLLLSGSVGGTLAPVLSAQIVRIFGPHAIPSMTLGCYGCAFALVLVAFVSERSKKDVARARAVAS